MLSLNHQRRFVDQTDLLDDEGVIWNAPAIEPGTSPRANPTVGTAMPLRLQYSHSVHKQSQRRVDQEVVSQQTMAAHHISPWKEQGYQEVVFIAMDAERESIPKIISNTTISNGETVCILKVLPDTSFESCGLCSIQAGQSCLNVRQAASFTMTGKSSELLEPFHSTDRNTVCSENRQEYLSMEI